MNTAVEWERKHADQLKAMAEAIADKDKYLAEEILNTIAPRPEGEHVLENEDSEHGQAKRQAKVVNPTSKRIDNPNGPAVIEGDGTRKWYRANMLHNAHGPAIIKPNGDVKYYHFGTRYKTAAELDAVTESTNRHNEKSKNIRNKQT